MRLKWSTLLFALSCLAVSHVDASVTFIAQFAVGDKNVATFSEDGLYAVDFATIKKALVQNKRQGDLDGIQVEKLCVYAASPDTLSDKVPEKAIDQSKYIPLEVGDRVISISTGNDLRIDGKDYKMFELKYITAKING